MEAEAEASGTARWAAERSDRAQGRPTTTAAVESAAAVAPTRQASEVEVWESVVAAEEFRRRTTETTT